MEALIEALISVEELDSILPHVRFMFLSEEEREDWNREGAISSVRNLFVLDSDKVRYSEKNTRCTLCYYAFVESDVVACFVCFEESVEVKCEHIFHEGCFEKIAAAWEKDRNEGRVMKPLKCPVDLKPFWFLNGMFGYIPHSGMEFDSPPRVRQRKEKGKRKGEDQKGKGKVVEGEGGGGGEGKKRKGKFNVDLTPVKFEAAIENIGWKQCGHCERELGSLVDAYMVLMCSHYFHKACVHQLRESGEMTATCGVGCPVVFNLYTEIVEILLPLRPDYEESMPPHGGVDVGNEPPFILHRIVERVDLGIISSLFHLVSDEEYGETSISQGGPREWDDGEDFP